MNSYVSEIGDEENAQGTPPVVGADGTVVQEEAPLRSTEFRDPMYAYTVAVGKKHSHASHWLQDAEEVGQLLTTLTGGVLPRREGVQEEQVLFE